jgi:hypothetical protein
LDLESRERLIAVFLGLSLLGSVGAEFTGEVDVRVRVVDAVTKVPVGAEISFRKGEAEVEKLGVATNGVFSFLRIGSLERVQLRVQAEDYATRGVSVELTNSRVSTVVELDRTAPFEGIVIAPTGQPAYRAKVLTFTKEKQFVMMEPGGKIQNFDGLPVDDTAKNGGFSVGPDRNAESLLIVHELGISQVLLVGWTNETRVQLRAWVAVKGRMLINERPAANEMIVASALRTPGAQWSVSLSKFETQTSATGNFFFEGLPPGEVRLMRKLQRARRASGFRTAHHLSWINQFKRICRIIFADERCADGSLWRRESLIGTRCE